MSSSLGSSFPSNGRGTRRARKPHDAAPSMTERQTQAYLLARDAIRRVQRTSSLVAESLSRAGVVNGGRQIGGGGNRATPASSS